MAKKSEMFSSQPEASSSKKKSKKSKKDDSFQPSKRLNWGENEALSLAKNWIAVLDDPKISTNQDKDTFWYRVLFLYNKEWAHHNRSKDSLTGKWAQISGKVKRFNIIYSQLISSGGQASKTSDLDLLTTALNEYKITYAADFTHISSWEFLKDKQKFLNPDPCVVGRRNKKRDDGLSMDAPMDPDASQEDEVPYTFHSNEEPNPRPTGRPSKTPRTTSSSAIGSANTSPSTFYKNINEQVANFNLLRSDELAQKTALNIELRRSERKKQRKYDMDMLRTPTDSFPEADREMIEREKNDIRERFASGYYNNV